MKSLASVQMTEVPISVSGYAKYVRTPELERKFSFTSKFVDPETGKLEVVNLWRPAKNPKYILLPRGACPDSEMDFRDKGSVVFFPKTPKPRPHQLDTFIETLDFLRQGLSGITLAYTGFGKTVLGYYCAAKLKRRTIVITTKEDIYEAWIKGASQFLGLPPSKVGEIRGDKCEVIGTDFVVAMIHSLSDVDKYPEWVFKGFGLVIFDEIHRLPAKQFSKVAGIFPSKLRLGLTATLGRSDGKELIALTHIGPIRSRTTVEEMVPRVLVKDTEWKSPMVPRYDPEKGKNIYVKMPASPGKTAHLERHMSKDPKRNAMIAADIVDVYKSGRKTVVFSTRTDHLSTLHTMLMNLGVSSTDIGFYIGGRTKADKALRDSTKTRPILLATYNMMGEGTSLDWLDTAVFAIPRAKVTQAGGRVRRTWPDKKSPLFLDYRDEDHPVWQQYGASRDRWYDSIKCVIQYVE